MPDGQNLPPPSPHPIAVIGAGLAGLSAACTLAARGHKVVLFEKNDWLGGKAAIFEQDGYRFDMGPTILTVPRVLERIFAEAGRKMSDALDLRRLDPQWRCFFEDGSVLDLAQDMAEMKATLSKYAPGTEAGYEDFIAMSAKLHEVSEKFFFWRSVEDVLDTMDFKKNMDLATLKDVLSLRMGTTVAGQIRKRVKDPRVCQMLDHFVQYVGSSPYGSPAVLCSIAHMQTNDGVWYPMGGTRAVPVALENLARDLGVTIRTSTGIARILSEANRVTAVETDTGETLPVSAVVSNMDAVRTYRELVGGQPAKTFAKRWKREPACSGVVMYLGPGPRLRTPGPPQLRLLPRPGRRVPPHLHPRRTRTQTPPATSPPPRAPNQAWPPQAAKPSTSSSTPPICAPTTTGPKCSPPTARSSWTN